MANFTPQEIEEILQQFFDVAGKRQYVGARYVPIFGRKGEGCIEWDKSDAYEPLTIVLYNGDSYTSRRYVPSGVDITNDSYWVITGRYNAQIEQYRQEVLGFQRQIDSLRYDLESDYVPFPDYNHYPKYGTLGQVLTTLANGATKWENPVVPSDEQATEVIEQWLNDHPEATTTVQDNSITDAKLVQDGGILSFVHGARVMQGESTIITSANYATNLPDMNDAGINRIYAINNCLSSIEHTPELTTNSATLITFAFNTYANKSWYVQLLVGASYGTHNPQYYMRSCWGGTWKNWEILFSGAIGADTIKTQPSDVETSNYETILPDYNEAENNTIYHVINCAHLIDNAPDDGTSATVLTFSANPSSNGSWKVQTIATTTGSIYVRVCWGGEWSNYINLNYANLFKTYLDSNDVLVRYKREINSTTYEEHLSDADNALPNNIYKISSVSNLIANMPTDTPTLSGTLFTICPLIGANKSWSTQYYVAARSGSTGPYMYMRSCWGGTWSNWNRIATTDEITSLAESAAESVVSESVVKGDQLLRRYYVETSVDKTKTKIDATSSILTFGDSITIGNVSNSNWVTELSNIIGCTTVNKAVGGALFGHLAEARPQQYWISTQIAGVSSAEWSAADLIFVAAGTNDAGYNTPNEELATRVQEAITTIKANTNAHIVFITPIRRNTENNTLNLKLPLISGIIENIALANGCSVICGFNFPIPMTTLETYIQAFTSDGLHPNQTGSKVYAQSVINAIM